MILKENPLLVDFLISMGKKCHNIRHINQLYCKADLRSSVFMNMKAKKLLWEYLKHAYLFPSSTWVVPLGHDSTLSNSKNLSASGVNGNFAIYFGRM